jgi:hypothetical protein
VIIKNIFQIIIFNYFFVFFYTAFSSRITLLKSAKGPISISECHSQGYYIIIENTSQSKNIDLINWKIQQENGKGDNLIFTFPDHCLLRPNHSLKVM